MAAVVAVAGLLRGFTGFGAGLVMVPLLGLLVGPAVAVPVAVMLDMAASLQLLPPALPAVRWRSVAPLGIAACATIPLGGTLLAHLDAAPMQRLISATVLLCVIALWTGWRYTRPPSTPVSLATGAASGLLTGMAGIGGPPVILLFHSGPERSEGIRASIIGYFTISQLVALIAFVFHRLLTAEALLLAALLAPVFLIATALGTRWFGRVDDRRFRAVSLAFLAVVAVVGLL
jgi:uncharacterized membrane protein YfcA